MQEIVKYWTEIALQHLLQSTAWCMSSCMGMHFVISEEENCVFIYFEWFMAHFQLRLRPRSNNSLFSLYLLGNVGGYEIYLICKIHINFFMQNNKTYVLIFWASFAYIFRIIIITIYFFYNYSCTNTIDKNSFKCRRRDCYLLFSTLAATVNADCYLVPQPVFE